MRGRLGQVLYAKLHRNRMKNRMCKRALRVWVPLGSGQGTRRILPLMPSHMEACYAWESVHSLHSPLGLHKLCPFATWSVPDLVIFENPSETVPVLDLHPKANVADRWWGNVFSMQGGNPLWRSLKQNIVKRILLLLKCVEGGIGGLEIIFGEVVHGRRGQLYVRKKLQ